MSSHPTLQPSITIRRATGADAEVIAALTRRAFAAQAALYDDDTLPPLSDTAESVTAEIAQGWVVLVAEDASRGRLEVTLSSAASISPCGGA